MTAVPLAYKYVATAMALMEIHYCASKLHLALDLPINQESAGRVIVFYPKPRGFALRLDAAHYSFVFAKSGRLRFIVKTDHPYYALRWGSPEYYAYYTKMTHKTSPIDTNGAYRLATNWLEAMEVNVSKLEKDDHPISRQQEIEGAPIPMFWVEWNREKWYSNGQPRITPEISVLMDADTGELIHLRQDDDSYSTRPLLLIKDMDALLAIPDEEFVKYTPLEKSNLVARFRAVDYPSPSGMDTNVTKNVMNMTPNARK